jgi:hypothetical protein
MPRRSFRNRNSTHEEMNMEFVVIMVSALGLAAGAYFVGKRIADKHGASVIRQKDYYEEALRDEIQRLRKQTRELIDRLERKQ